MRAVAGKKSGRGQTLKPGDLCYWLADIQTMGKTFQIFTAHNVI
jgi:hypothetical protein